METIKRQAGTVRMVV